jgi:hypothetical protein
MLQRAALDRESHAYRGARSTASRPIWCRAVIASEDARFCSHQGFDVDAIQGALKNNERRPSRIQGRFHHQPADGQERIFVAPTLLRPKRAEAYLPS